MSNIKNNSYGRPLHSLPEEIAEHKSIRRAHEYNPNRDRGMVRNIHIYEFDGCLFNTPTLSRSIMTHSTRQLVLDGNLLFEGGWYNIPNVLEMTGHNAGDEVDPAKWSDYWFNDLVELARNSKDDPETASILVSARDRANFTDVLIRMTESITGNPLFDEFYLRDMQNLRKKNGQNLKGRILKDLLLEYPYASEVRIYECGIKLQLFVGRVASFEELVAVHGKAFAAHTPSVDIKVFPVIHEYRNLDPVLEWSLLTKLFNDNNSIYAIKSKRGYKGKYRLFQGKKDVIEIDETDSNSWDLLSSMAELLIPSEYEDRMAFYGEMLSSSPSSDIKNRKFQCSNYSIIRPEQLSETLQSLVSTPLIFLRCLESTSPSIESERILLLAGPRIKNHSLLRITKEDLPTINWTSFPNDSPYENSNNNVIDTIRLKLPIFHVESTGI